MELYYYKKVRKTWELLENRFYKHIEKLFMIRNYNITDLDKIIKIWLEWSYISHNFISSEFWDSQVDDMKNIYIPSSETFVFEEDNKIKWFLSYYKWTVVALFVHPDFQRRGIGTKLLDFIKDANKELNLNVYIENKKSTEYYISQWFKTRQIQTCQFTWHKEFFMIWNK
jgi:putative acetyltransferase